MIDYYIETQNHGKWWTVDLWRDSGFFGRKEILLTEHCNTKEEMDLVIKIMKANKEKYIRDYNDGLLGHHYIPL